MSDNEDGSSPRGAGSSDEKPEISDIDIELLISEVKKRPYLYEKAFHEFIERERKQKLWLEVCQATIKNWNEYDCKKKKDTEKKIKSKWRYLTNVYFKKFAGSEESEPLSKKKRMPSLSFLIPTMSGNNINIQANNNNDRSDFDLVMDVVNRQNAQNDTMLSTSSQNIQSCSSSQNVMSSTSSQNDRGLELIEDRGPQTPIQDVQEPIQDVQEPTSDIQESMTDAEGPTTDLGEPIPVVYEPIPGTEDPIIYQDYIPAPQEPRRLCQAPIIQPISVYPCENTYFCLMLVQMMRKMTENQIYYARSGILGTMNDASNLGNKTINEEPEGETGVMAGANHPITEDPGPSSQDDHTYTAATQRPRNERGESQSPVNGDEEDVGVQMS